MVKARGRSLRAAGEAMQGVHVDRFASLAMTKGCRE
jgi:hypothetical protein